MKNSLLNPFQFMLPILLFGSFFLIASITNAQSVSIKKCQYINEINSNATEKTNFGTDFIFTDDGGFLVTGSILLGGQNQEPITKKFNGQLQFSKTHGELDRKEVPASVLQYQGFYYVVGSSSKPFTNKNVFLSKFTLSGLLVWTKTYNSNHDDTATKIVKATGNNNHLIIIGSTNSHFAQPSLNDDEVMAFKVNAQDGTLINGVHTYGIPNVHDRGFDITPAVEGSGYIILGTRRSANISTLVIPVDANLDRTPQDPLVINDIGQDYHATSIKKSGNKYYMAGYYKYQQEQDGLLMRLNADFTGLSCRRYDFPFYKDFFSDLEADASGNLYIAGVSNPAFGGLKSGRLMKFNSNLNSIWHKRTINYSFVDDQVLYGLDISGSNIGMTGAVIATNTFPEKYNLLVIEANTNGASCCMEGRPRLTPRVIKPEIRGPLLNDKLQHQIKTLYFSKTIGKATKICDNFSIPFQSENNTNLRKAEEQFNAVSIYPNPNDGEFTVELDPRLADQLEIMTVNGQSVYQVNYIEADRFIVNLKDLPAGIYLMKVTNNNGTMNVRRLVITER